MNLKLCGAALICCAAATAAADWGLHPAPLIPADNPLSEAKIALGKRLFHETALSINRTTSCASCHQPERHFTDGLPRAVGALGEVHPRNTPTLYNVAYSASLGWSDDGLIRLEQQHRVPLFNQTPVEMGYQDAFVARLQTEASYGEAFAAAFGGEITTERVVMALASYVRTLVPPESAFDRYLFYDEPLSADARAGLDLFFSARLGCASCHASFTLSGPINHAEQSAAPVFHVNGVGGSNQAWRAPTLRVVSATAPYMHDGSIPDLAGVLSHYETTDAERVPDFTLNDTERRQLITFLETL